METNEAPERVNIYDHYIQIYNNPNVEYRGPQVISSILILDLFLMIIRNIPLHFKLPAAFVSGIVIGEFQRQSDVLMGNSGPKFSANEVIIPASSFFTWRRNIFQGCENAYSNNNSKFYWMDKYQNFKFKVTKTPDVSESTKKALVIGGVLFSSSLILKMLNKLPMISRRLPIWSLYLVGAFACRDNLSLSFNIVTPQ